jgi:diaminopimelate decarboxylase
MDGRIFLASVKNLFDIAIQFKGLEFINLGGGFGIPYRKQQGEPPLDITALGESLDRYMHKFSTDYGKELQFMIEPGRYIPAESGVLLGTVHAVKNNGFIKFAGTDLGFSVLPRPMLYDSWHDIEVYRRDDGPLFREGQLDLINIVGNMCESGDYIARERMLPPLAEGDVLGVLDTGAYCYAMSSICNQRQRPAEILIREDSSVKLIRRRDTYEDMIQNMMGL